MPVLSWLRIKRIYWQLISLILLNSNFYRPFYSPLKYFPCPILNCHACPYAQTTCAIGALQFFIMMKRIPYLILSVFLFSSFFFGRLFCGWICPLGLIQDLFSKLRKKHFHIPHFLRYLKFFVLLMIIIIPLFYYITPFCKFICPMGVIGGSFAFLFDKSLLQLPLNLFKFKVFLTLIFLLSFIFWRRPFCAVFCPAGALLSFLHKFSIKKITFDEDKCTKCGECITKCPAGLIPYKDYNSFDCIRCYECVKICKFNAFKIL